MLTANPSYDYDDDCYDDDSWHVKGVSYKTCEKFVAESPEIRCKKIGEDGSRGYHGCPASCGMCGGCADDWSWRMWRRNDADCHTVSKMADTLCNNMGKDGRKAYAACPATCGLCAAPEGGKEDCVDSTSWSFAGGSDKGCELVSKNPDMRCRKRDNAGVKAHFACPAACGQCEAKCEDDEAWHMKDFPHRNCEQVARNPDMRCRKKGEDGRKARDACPDACGYCDDLENDIW